MNIDKLKELLKPEEGFSSKPYKDTNGYLTIGYGHNLSAKGIDINKYNKLWPKGISLGEAESLLEQDIMNSIDQLRSCVPFFKSLDEVRQAVLTDMCFNLGINKLIAFHDTFSFISRGDYKHAAVEMLDSLWAKQVKGRAIKLANMMETGKWPLINRD